MIRGQDKIMGWLNVYTDWYDDEGVSYSQS